MGEQVQHPEHPPDDETDVVHLLTERITRHREHEHEHHLPEEQHHEEHAELHLHGLRDWLHLTI